MGIVNIVDIVIGEESFLFGSEDCSSSVGKATYLTPEQVRNFSTVSIRKVYDNPDNPYHYTAVGSFSRSISPRNLQSIRSGDIYLVNGHTAIIATEPDKQGNIVTVQFNRDIDVAHNKLLGGGLYSYNLLS